MSQSGFTPILIYSSSTASNLPSASNLINSTLGSELAINISDGKLFYKDNSNNVQVIAWKITPTSAGGTGLTSYTAGDMLYYASGTVLSKLAIGTSGYYIRSSGSAPQWSAPAALTKTDDTNLTLTLGGSASTALLNAASLTLGWTGQLAVTRGGTGLASLAQGDILYGSAANTLSALPKNTTATRYLANTGTSNNAAWDQVNLVNGVTGTLPTGNGGTGLTSFTTNGVVYASSTSALATGSNVIYNGSSFQVSGKSSYFDPDLNSSGGFNILASYSYNDNNVNTIGGTNTFQNGHHIIHIETGTGVSSIPIYTNSGIGTAYSYIYLHPDAATWAISSSSPTITFTAAGSSGNTFSVQLNSNTGSATIQRTAGSLVYVVYIQRLAIL